MNKPTRVPETSSLRFRRFGPDGPAYEILDDTGPSLLVRVLETGEELEHPHARAASDPAA